METPSPAPDASRNRGARRRRQLVACAAAISLAVLVGVWLVFLRSPAELPLTGDLVVYLQPGGVNTPPLRVGDAGALPVRDGQRMTLEVRYPQPAHTYIVWITSSGEVIPLYPWNMDAVEVKKLAGVPTDLRPGKYVLSPMTMGKGWTLGKGSGLETVLLLARRTPLDSKTELDELLTGVAPPAMRHPQEAAILAWDRHGNKLTSILDQNRGSDIDRKAQDGPLLDRIGKLQEHFDLIRIVRFAHEGEK